MSGNIFLSYRRDDSKHVSGRIVDRLQDRFGKDRLFLDVDSIELGRDFVEVLSARVAACDVMLVVIGPDWLNIRDKAGARRLDDPSDFVRIEVEAALARNIPVIPVLVDKAEPPQAEHLPDTLDALSRRQAIRVDHESFGADTTRLTDALAQLLDEPDIIPPSVGPDVEDIQPAELPDEDYDALGWFAAVSPLFFMAVVVLVSAIGGVNQKDTVVVMLGGAAVGTLLLWAVRWYQPRALSRATFVVGAALFCLYVVPVLLFSG